MILRLYFDFISPYAYLAWTQSPALAQRHGRSLEPIPVLFAAFLNAYGHKGPAQIPPKRRYVFKDILRLAHHLEVPLFPPPRHPFNPLLPLRVATLPELSDAERIRAITALFNATWGGSPDHPSPGIDTPELVAQALEPAGLDAHALMAAATTDANKLRLRQNTEVALADGAFGVPTFVVEDELFWGVDSLPHLERFLSGEDPIDPRLLERLADVW